MSRYIGAGQNDRFDVRIQELVSKVQNPGGFLRKKFFRVHFGFFFLVVWPFWTNLHEILAPMLKLNLPATLFYKKNHFDQPFLR